MRGFHAASCRIGKFVQRLREAEEIMNRRQRFGAADRNNIGVPVSTDDYNRARFRERGNDIDHDRASRTGVQRECGRTMGNEQCGQAIHGNNPKVASTVACLIGLK